MEETKKQHLEFIQNAITRMNTNSFQIKGMAVAIVSALLAVYVATNNVAFIFLGIVPTILFWLLDSYYLQLERKYRVLYNDVISRNPETIDFKLGVGKSKAEDKTFFFQSLMSRTEFWFYFPTAILVAIVVIVSHCIAK